MVISVANYAYLVPYVENEDELFLKTIIPSLFISSSTGDWFKEQQNKG